MRPGGCRGSKSMSKLYNFKRKPAWTVRPVPCEDCGVLLECELRRRGPTPSVCRSCQNKRYEAHTKGTVAGQRRRRRKTLLAKLKRLEARLARDQLALVQVREELEATATGEPVAILHDDLGHPSAGH